MRLHSLQYLRALAALAVVYSHSVIQVDSFEAVLPHRGSFGVDVFFVISGFIMVYIARSGDTPARFLYNRVRRVVPLYWFFTLLMAAVLLLAPGIFKTTVFSWTTLLQSLLFIPHYSLSHPDSLWPLVAPGWSLNYEMYFYTCFALSLFVAARFRLVSITVLILLVYLISIAAGNGSPTDTRDPALPAFYGNAIVFEFVFGMAIAAAWQRGWRMPTAVAWSSLAVGTAVLVLPAEVHAPRLIQFGIPSAMIVFATISLRMPEVRWCVVLGDASYALYLSHLFTLGVLRKLLPPWLGDDTAAAWQFVLISLTVCTIVSVLVHRFVDNGVLRVDWLRGWRARAAPTHLSADDVARKPGSSTPGSEQDSTSGNEPGSTTLGKRSEI